MEKCKTCRKEIDVEKDEHMPITLCSTLEGYKGYNIEFVICRDCIEKQMKNKQSENDGNLPR